MWKLTAAAALGLVVSFAAAAHASDEVDSGTPVAFAALQDFSDAGDLIEPVGLVRGDDGSTQRFYVAPIVGASWGQFLVEGDSIANPGLFTAGGAAGMAFSRPSGQWRLEGEGRYRDGFERSLGLISVGATDNWSCLANAWRDVAFTERFGGYGGGGIGVGGYRFLYSGGGDEFVNNQLTQFAWQVGGGLIYAVSDRVTLDLGYRYYSVGAARTCRCPDPGEGILNQFVANELLFAVRIYEPFRGWR